MQNKAISDAVQHQHFRFSPSGTRAFHVVLLVIMGLATAFGIVLAGINARLDQEVHNAEIPIHRQPVAYPSR